MGSCFFFSEGFQVRRAGRALVRQERTWTDAKNNWTIGPTRDPILQHRCRRPTTGRMSIDVSLGSCCYRPPFRRRLFAKEPRQKGNPARNPANDRNRPNIYIYIYIYIIIYYLFPSLSGVACLWIRLPYTIQYIYKYTYTE